MKPSEALEKAAEIQATQGHCKGTLKDEEGRVCLQGALLAACGVDLERYEALSDIDHDAAILFDKAHFYVGRHLHAGATHVWNDHLSTTEEDVVLALKGSAELAREEGE